MDNQEGKKFQGAVALSVLVHLVFIGLFFFGMPSLFQKLPEEPDAFTFEVLPMSAITNIKNERKSSAKVKEAKKSKEVKKSKPKAKPKPAPKPKEVVKDKSKKKVEKVPTKKKKAPAKKQKEKLKAKPKPEEDAIASILKNLEKDSEGTDAKAVTKKNSEVKGDKYSRGKNYNEDAPLSISENLYIRNQIERHWRKPAESLISQGIRVVMEIELTKDASVTKIKIIKVFCPSGSDVTCNLVKDSAIRAVYKASPFEKLQTERYNSWKTLSLTIDPNNMGQ